MADWCLDEKTKLFTEDNKGWRLDAVDRDYKNFAYLTFSSRKEHKALLGGELTISERFKPFRFVDVNLDL